MEKLSLFELIKHYKYIEIPALQRDYAQGREHENEVRSSFVAFLRDVLVNKKRDNLDFIYGVCVSKPQCRLILIDGQQRITTLFLLHWYLAAVDGKESSNDFKQIMQDDGASSRFMYNTRPSSKAFCNNLVNNVDRIMAYLVDTGDKGVIEPLSYIIKNQKWFLMHWINDPTVKAMLVMLDSIHEAFWEYKDGLYNKLKNNPLTIDFLDLNNLGLHEAGQLYIKMNSRGKLLTKYENLGV